MRSATHAKLQERHEHTHPSFSRDADLPLQEIHGAVGSFGRFSIEALKVCHPQNASPEDCAHTNGWSLRHCLRSSARRALQIPDMAVRSQDALSSHRWRRHGRVGRQTPKCGSICLVSNDQHMWVRKRKWQTTTSGSDSTRVHTYYSNISMVQDI